VPNIFGTDGVRGVANTSLTPEQALRIGRAGADRLAAGRTGRSFLVLGRDTRLSGDLLTAAVTAGCCSVGVDVVDVGIVPTPGVALLTRRLGAAGGVVISASHNPVDDNGIKFFDHNGYKLSAETEALVEEKVVARSDRLPRPVGSGVGRRQDGRAHVRDYADHLTTCLEADLQDMRVVFDAGFGATALLGTEVLGRSGVDVISMNDSYDGSRINVECGSTNPGEMAGVVTESGADAGLALDGDGDRVILADEKGQIVDGDQILAILALDLIARKALPKKTVVATVMSNLGLDLAIREAGGRVVRTPVGDRSVLQAMLETGLVLGGEQSGHIILLRHGTTGDGLLAGLAVLSVMARSGRPLSELASKVVRLPQVLVNVIVNQKEKLQTSEKVATAIERAREALGHTGRVLVRPSGTEPLVRVMIEGRDGPLINKMAMELAGVVAEELGGEIAD
jgi:phosphoglucosamine mutase